MNVRERGLGLALGREVNPGFRKLKILLPHFPFNIVDRVAHLPILGLLVR